MKDFLTAGIFSGFPSWKSIAFAGEVTPKILKCEVVTEGEIPRPLYLAAIISREEKMAWQSFQDVLDHTMTLAQGGLRGFFGFDVLSIDIQQGMKNFNPRALSQLIINHARELGPDQKALIRYGQLFALLHYRAPADWGKIEVKTHVDFFSQAAASSEVTEASVLAALRGSGSKNKNSSGDQLDLLLKKLLKESGQEPGAIYLLHDLSTQSVWDPSNKVQQQRVRDWIEREKQSRAGSLPDVFLYLSATQALLEFSRHF
ncbi:MAG: hypothetical protein V1882_08190 [Candidatus Omnitrophota bacterium]